MSTFYPITTMRLVLPLLLCMLGGFAAYATGGGRPGQKADPVPAPEDMVSVPAGLYRAPVGALAEAGGEKVEAFFLDKAPVTNAQFLEFVRANPRWQRSQVPGLLADKGYLGYWKDDLDFGPDSLATRPVVNVSWFAARAFLAAQGKRLPTTAEWEWAASTGATRPGGTPDPDIAARLAGWLSAPLPAVPDAVRASGPDHLGAYDLHGLVWEWVLDIERELAPADLRDAGGVDFEAFCGGGGSTAIDPTDYAAFLRYGFRSGIDARYTGSAMGFRGARDLLNLFHRRP